MTNRQTNTPGEKKKKQFSGQILSEDVSLGTLCACVFDRTRPLVKSRLNGGPRTEQRRRLGPG